MEPMTVKNVIREGIHTTVHARVGKRYARVTSTHRGGCLHLGEIRLADLSNARQVFITTTTDWSRTQVDELDRYLAGLWERHLG